MDLVSWIPQALLVAGYVKGTEFFHGILLFAAKCVQLISIQNLTLNLFISFPIANFPRGHCYTAFSLSSQGFWRTWETSNISDALKCTRHHADYNLNISFLSQMSSFSAFNEATQLVGFFLV